jgi:hypothetical protein
MVTLLGGVDRFLRARTPLVPGEWLREYERTAVIIDLEEDLPIEGATPPPSG